jgi:hypothetical protein
MEDGGERANPGSNSMDSMPAATGAQRSMRTGYRPATSQRDAIATEALEAAREMPPGPQRAEALKRAGLLRYAADSEGVIFAKRGRPRK